jgi:hypothetical protein
MKVLRIEVRQSEECNVMALLYTRHGRQLHLGKHCRRMRRRFWSGEGGAGKSGFHGNFLSELKCCNELSTVKQKKI